MQQSGLSAEMYRAVVAVVDDRMQAISVTRRDYERLEVRIERVEAALVRLAEAQARTEERLDRLEAAVERLAEAQARTEERVNQLAEAQARTEQQIQALVQRMDKFEDIQSRMRGDLLELTYQRRAGSYLGRVLRRVRAWVPFELEEELEPRLSESDYLDLLRADLLMRGQPRERREIAEVWLAVEVSAVVDRGDVERAVRRAGHLRKAGYVALAAVAGEQATEGAEDMAQREGAVMVLDGSVAFWEQALSQALAG